MPFPSPYVIESPSLENLFRDKTTGLPLANGVVAWYQDSNRTVLKDIYQQVREPDGTYSFVTLPNPLTLSSIGTYADNDGNDINVYLYPYSGTPADPTPGELELYYVTVYASAPPVGDSAFQFDREAWPPNAGGGNNPTDVFEGTQNQLANPQFVEVLFEPDVGASDYTISLSGPISVLVAPDWYIDANTNSSGTVKVQWINDISGTAESDPPYALSIQGAGLSSLRLRQRLTNSPRLFYNKFVAASFQASSQDFSPMTLNMSWINSDPSTPIEFFSGVIPASGAFTTLSGTKQITVLNVDNADDGYVDVTVDAADPNRHFQITSLQIVQVQNLQSSTQFLQESTPRQIDHLFHYYKPELEYKPIPSYLVGWDFPLNPAQALGPTVAAFATGANKSNYVWDQTIVFQSVNSGLTYSRSSTTNGLSITGAIASQFAVIQYLEAAQARELLSQHNAIALKGAISTGTIQGYVNLYWTTDATLPDLKAANYNSLVSGLTAGVPAVANGTWTKVTRDTLGDANFLLTTTNTEFNFSGWDATATAGKTTATYIAIVVSFASLPVASVVTLDYVSLVGGDIATRPAPQTPTAVLNDCKLYYQKSFATQTVPASAAGALNATYFVQTVAATNAQLGPICNFPVELRAIPTVTLYNPVNANSQIYSVGGGFDWAASSANDIGQNGFITIGTPPAGTPGSACAVHWTADSRLGVVL